MAAKRPSKRRHRSARDVELSLIPVMSLLVALVPMLLQTAVFETTAAIPMSLPSADQVRYLEELSAEALADALTLALTDEGFVLATGRRTLARIPRLPAPAGEGSRGGFDYATLGRELAAAQARRPAQQALTLLIEDQVVYDEIVRTMDRSRPYFPAVSLADRVAVPGQE